MGIEKQGSKGGNYVGGFLQLFDWNAKSRKKLFSSKSDLPERSKQKKRFDGTLPSTRLQTMDEDEISAGSSIKGSNDYSRASSVTDEDFYGSKGPGVVARLMGLDSLPKSNTPDHYSTPLFDCQSLPDSFYKTKNLECSQDLQIMQEKYQKIIQRPIEKFQAEVLPPKSARSIPITHHKLLSPIKSANFVSSKDATEIMEAAARIIELEPQASKKTKLPLAGGSSTGPLKVKDLKEKVQATQKPIKMSVESSGVKHARGHSRNKSWTGGSSVDSKPVMIFRDSEESLSGVQSKGKSVSLALQAKANVQKREALNSNNSRTDRSRSEKGEFSPKMTFTSQSGPQKTTVKKASTQISTNVLRQNNQKQNCSIDRGSLPLKSNAQGGKSVNVDFSSSKRQNSCKLITNSKDDKRHVKSSNTERARKKRSIDGNYRPEKNQAAQNLQKDKNGTPIQSGATKNTQSSWEKDGGEGTDVISFTFTAPMRSTDVRENCNNFLADSPSKRKMLNLDSMAASKLSFLGHSVKRGDSLSTFLEQQLKELAHKVEFSQQKSGAVSPMSSNMEEEYSMKDGNYSVNLEGQLGSSLYSLRDAKGSVTGQKFQGLVEEKGVLGRNISADRMFCSFRLPSPVSVLEHNSFTESCNSPNSADSNHSTGGGNKCSPLQFQDNLRACSTNTFLPFEGEAELSDSGSSTSSRSFPKKRETTLTRSWELKYVKKILCNIDHMFNDYAMGKANEIINSYLFDQLESCKHNFNECGPVPRMNRRLLFDCVSECSDLRCRKYAVGGCKSWAKGVRVVKQKERIAEDVYKEISGWSAMGDFMVDELVDSDMSSSPFGRWLDYDIEGFELGMKIEARILNSLIDEVVADILVL